MPAPVDNFGELGIVIPDVPEPITGWREWTVEWDLHSPALNNRNWEWPVGPDATIVSGFDMRRWEPGRPFIAQCPHSRASLTDPTRGFYPAYRWDGATPTATCEQCPSPTAEGHQGYGCGIYAYKALDRFHMSSPRLANVTGRVIVYGNVWEHDAGYRASRAELTGILVPQVFATETPTHWQGSNQYAAADYLAGLAVLAVRYRVPIFIPINRFAPNNPTGPALLHFDAAIRFHDPAGNMPFELAELAPDTFLHFARNVWGYRWSDAITRLERRERERLTLAEHLRLTASHQLTPETIAKVREALGLDADPEEDPHG